VSDQTQGRQDEQQAQPGVVAQARADCAAGREWRARDRLTGYLADHDDPEALELLGEVASAMRDLPAAGAAWFATARRGEDVDAATEAWRERYDDDFAEMWQTLPASVRRRTGSTRVEALRRRAELAQWPDGHDGQAGSSDDAEPGEPAEQSAGQAPPTAGRSDADTTNGTDTTSGTDTTNGNGVDAAVVIAVVIAVFLLVCTVVGFVTVLRWVVPG
jgi:hypothetical protein